ncbi:MAG: MmcQ/YjbR family DNA-binding protein [Ferrovibrio sp.]|uniref:MmcQ/YjbR family DNA-binding protein n=1 Tax=Ferrovibrio sp. TaxID=1917215 RepID=UPI00261F8660|nr:MmcQ/YjbR family DNA-binding protein [Ferrovibrio sp.]MCW0234815.1 MmcQ/YjbR family DNA-binding protein [Ferrovibrio sp.]
MAKYQVPKKNDVRRMAPKAPTDRLRALCLALPEAEERETWEIPTYRIRGKIFALESAIEGRRAVWCKPQPGSQEVLVGADPGRFFVPPYLGHKGWVGMWLDKTEAGRVNWSEVERLVRRSYRLIAPKKLAALLAED